MLQNRFLQLTLALLAFTATQAKKPAGSPGGGKPAEPAPAPLTEPASEPDSDQCGHTCDCFTCKSVSDNGDGTLNVEVGHCKAGSISWMCCTGTDGNFNDGGDDDCKVLSGGANCAGSKCETIPEHGGLTVQVPADATYITVNTHDGQTFGDAGMSTVCGGSGNAQGGKCASQMGDPVTAHCMIDFDLVADCGYTGGAATTTGAPPATTTGAPPATTTEAPPATTTEAPPATTTEAPPATTTEAPPATTTEAPPVKSSPGGSSKSNPSPGGSAKTASAPGPSPGGGNKAPSTCAADEVIPNPVPDWLPAGPRCCTGFFDNGDKWAQCDTSSCPNNFGMKNLLCHNFGSPQFDEVGTPGKPAGSNNCPYIESDKAICDTSYYTAINGVNCRNNPNSNGGKNHCLGKVRCQSTGVKYPDAKNQASYGTDELGFLGTGSGAIEDFGLCNPAAEAAGMGAGTDCFYMGNSDNYKVCGEDGADDGEEPPIETTTGAPPATTTEAPPATTTEAPPATTTPPPPPPATTVPPPATTTTGPPPTTRASGSGDPHFKTWTGDKYDYHGECDLVLLDNPDFMFGLGLRIHIRTTRVKYFSFIEKVAIQIGKDVLEFDNDVENFLLNGVKAEANLKHHKTKLGPYIVRRDPKALSIRLHDEGRHDHHVAKIDLHTRKNGFPAVIVDGGNTEVFKGSLGLLGDWSTGKRMARDGVTEMNGEDATAFALEWQVRDTEPTLFNESRFPQFPTTCTPPAKKLGSRLGESSFQKEAEKACAHWKEDMEDCIFDVIATRDVLVAEEGHIVHLS